MQPTPQRKIEWNFESLTLTDVLTIVRWQNDTNLRRALTKLLFIAQRFSPVPLDGYPFSETLHEFIEAMHTHVLAQAEADYLREGGGNP